VEHDQPGERLAFAGVVPGGVEGVSDFGVGVIVE
jgi:hypothetical protein